MELAEASSMLEIIEEQQKLLKEQQQTINSLCSQLHELKKQQQQKPQEQPEPQNNPTELSKVSNPNIKYDVYAVIEEILNLEAVLDSEVYTLLDAIGTDKKLENVFDIELEMDAWDNYELENSVIFFDELMYDLTDEQYDYFRLVYMPQIQSICNKWSSLKKEKKKIDEYMMFKVSLYNVFNNSYNLTMEEYINQICERKEDYNMVAYFTEEDKLNLYIEFNPLKKVNRGNYLYIYKLFLDFNPNWKQDNYVYKVKQIEAYSEEATHFTCDDDLKILNDFLYFSEEIDKYFLKEFHSIFFKEAQKSQYKKKGKGEI